MIHSYNISNLLATPSCGWFNGYVRKWTCQAFIIIVIWWSLNKHSEHITKWFSTRLVSRDISDITKTFVSDRCLINIDPMVFFYLHILYYYPHSQSWRQITTWKGVGGQVVIIVADWPGHLNKSFYVNLPDVKWWRKHITPWEKFNS